MLLKQEKLSPEKGAKFPQPLLKLIRTFPWISGSNHLVHYYLITLQIYLTLNKPQGQVVKVIRCDFLLFMGVWYTLTLKEFTANRICFVKTSVSIYTSEDPGYALHRLMQHQQTLGKTPWVQEPCSVLPLLLEPTLDLIYSYTFTKLSWLVEFVCVCV